MGSSVFNATSLSMHSLPSLLCLNIFKKSPFLSNFSQNLVWVQINFCSHSHAFLFWCSLFDLRSVSRQGHTTHILWKFLHKPVKNCIFKTSIKCKVYVVNCKSYIVPYWLSYLYIQRKSSNEKHCVSTVKQKKSHECMSSNHKCLQLCCLLLFFVLECSEYT